MYIRLRIPLNLSSSPLLKTFIHFLVSHIKQSFILCLAFHCSKSSTYISSCMLVSTANHLHQLIGNAFGNWDKGVKYIKFPSLLVTISYHCNEAQDHWWFYLLGVREKYAGSSISDHGNDIWGIAALAFAAYPHY